MKWIYTILLLNAVQICFSQTTLRGTVRDSMQNPLVSASIIAQPQDSTENLRFSISDINGKYLLNLKKITYQITVNHMGYRPFVFHYYPTNDETKDITLKDSNIELEEVVVELPIVVKQDTTLYNVQAFVSGDERKLKNVLNKLPGIEVDKSGNITVQGKKVTTMLVEGREFFGGGTKLAVENIPADVVDKIEVIDNYNKVSILKNLSNSDEMAMNVKLKEDKKNFAFGNIEAGKGNKNFYHADAKIFYYNPKKSINFIGNSNNINWKILTFEDYINFRGGTNAIFKTGSNAYKLSNNDFSQFFINKDVSKSNNLFGAINLNQELNNKLNISGYIMVTTSDDATRQYTVNQYLDFTENKQESSQNKQLLGIGKITFDYTPNLKEKWLFNTQFKRTDGSNNNSIQSEIGSANNLFLTHKELISNYFNQNIEWHKRIGSLHTISFLTDYTFDENKPISNWNTDTYILQNLIPIQTDTAYHLKQTKNTRNHNFNNILKYFWNLHRNHHLYVSIGNTFTSQYFFTEDLQLLTNGNVSNFNNNGFGNNLHFKLNDLFLGIDYKFKAGIFVLKPGLFVHSYHWNIDQDTNFNKNKIVVLPDFLAKVEFRKMKKLQFNYNLNSSFSEFYLYSNKFHLLSYNAIFKGNENLENELYHVLSLRYSQLKIYGGISIYANANYTKKATSIRNSVIYNGINQQISPILLNNQDEKWNLLGNIKKTFHNIIYSLSVNYNFTKYPQQTNNLFSTNKNNTGSARLSAKTIFDNFPTIEVGYGHGFSRYSLSNNSVNFSTSEISLSSDYAFGNGFIFNFEYTRNNYQNRTTNLKSTYETADATLSYRKENSAWSYKITANNLFNTGYKQRNSFSDYFISDNKTYILPRIIVLSIAYNL